MGSDESQFNVSLIVIDKVKRRAVFTDHRGKRETMRNTTVTPRMNPALRWAAMRASFNVSLIVMDKVTSPSRPLLDKVTIRHKGSIDHNF